MIPIPGQLIAIATFPGVIVHEAAHFLFCRWLKLAVLDVCFFRVGNPAGYVIHEPAKNFRSAFLVSMGPFLVNTLLCIVFCSAGFMPVWKLHIVDPLAYFFYWLGLSIGMHSFPSTQDLKVIWQLAPPEAKHGNILAIVAYPLIAVLYIANLARVVWADLGYGILVGVLGPLAVFKALA